MRALVTGAAGFIGSHLSEALIARGDKVVGVDCFTDYYDPAVKRSNITDVLGSPDFTLVEADLMKADLEQLLDGVDVVFHQAGQPGVRLSWSDGFSTYVERNILVTQRLLEAARGTRLRRFVNASSSSVYGNSPTYPCTEQTLPQPHSPYGVTKLSAEKLCDLYGRNWGLPVTSLRYFTVYGPRQRPDMGIHKFLQAALTGAPIPLFGTGSHIRDFTFVGDIVAANLAAAESDIDSPSIVNIAGGSSIDVSSLLSLIERLVGRPLVIDHLPEQPGDVQRTGGSTDLAERLLGWQAQADLETGLKAQLDSVRLMLESS